MDALIVEDSSFMRKILRNILDDLDFEEVFEAENGEEGVEQFNEHRPDLVLLDIVMEEMTGLEALDEIMDTDPEATVVMISAVGQQQMVDQALDSGAQEFIEKPFENEDVKDTLADVMGI